jgi:hypothetical protein
MSESTDFDVEVRMYPVGVSRVGLESREGKPDAITGYASVFYDGTPDTEYDLAPNMKERIMPGAFDNVMLERHDVMGLYNHDPNFVLGRIGAGTMHMAVDGRGLRYTIDPPQTGYARDLKESLRRGDIPGSSFSFKATHETYSREGMNKIREIRSAKVYDVGPVAMPAYKGTTAQVSKRSLDALAAIEIRAEAPELKIDDHVQWWDEDEDEGSGIYCIEPRFGVVMAIGADGPLGVPGGRVKINGTASDPALIVQSFSPMGGDEATYELTNCLYLLHASDVVKVLDGPGVINLTPTKIRSEEGGVRRTMDKSEAALRLRERIVKGAI